MMTPEEFWLKMCTLQTKYNNNPEILHIEMDELMCKLLCELGYGKGIDVFKRAEIWYS